MFIVKFSPTLLNFGYNFVLFVNSFGTLCSLTKWCCDNCSQVHHRGKWMDPCSVFHFLKTIVLWRLCQKICQTKVFWVLFFNFRKQADSDVYYLCITMTTTSPNSQQTLYYKWVLKTHTNQPFEWQSFNVEPT